MLNVFNLIVRCFFTVLTHVIPIGRSHSFCYGCPALGAPRLAVQLSELPKPMPSARGAYSEAQTYLRYPRMTSTNSDLS